MSWLNGLTRRSIENMPLTNSSLLSLFGGWQSATGRQVSQESALRVGAAFRGTQIIANAIGGMPLKVFAVRDRSEVTTSFLAARQFPLTPLTFGTMVVAHQVLWGNAYVWKQRNAAGVITGLIPVHPSRVSVDVVDERAIGVPWVKRFTVDGIPYTPYEIMHVMGPLTLDGIEGIGPIGYVREAFGIALTAEEAAAKLYANGMMLGGVLETDRDLTQEMAEALKKRWRAKLSGVNAAHDVAILDRGAKFHSLTMPPADAQFLESRKFQVTEIARLLGLPGWILNDQEKSTSWGSGMEQQSAAMVMFTLKPYAQAIEQQINAEILPRTQYAEFVVDGLLRGDSATRATYYNAGITGGWLVPNDVRSRENLPPVPWGNEPYLPNNTSAEAQKDDAAKDNAPREGSSDDED